MGGFFDFLASAGKAIWQMLSLDPDVAVWFAAHPRSLEISIVVAALAGISTLLGNSVVLFLNRVRGWRFLATLLLNGSAMVLLYLVQALVIAIVGPLLVGENPGFPVVLRGVMLAAAPMVFGFLGLIPYLGPAITRLLQAWGVVALWLVVTSVFGTDLWVGLAIAVIGWGVMQLISWGLARPVTRLSDRVWRMLTGKPAMMTGQDLLSGHFFMPLDAGLEREEVR